MKQKHFFVLLYMALFSVMLSCNPYQKLLKSDDIALKYQKAEEYYNNKDYTRALPLLEDLLTYYRGSAQAEKIYFYLANTYYEMGDHMLAAYQYKNFVEAYPASIYTEDAFFYYAYSLYQDSPYKDLDQANTGNAIEAFKLFISKYPDSKRVEESNKLIDELVAKLEEKAIQNALLYYKIRDYKAAVWSLRNVLVQYPATKEREKLEFHIVKAAYLLAENSIETKKKERYINAMQYYNEFKEKYPKSAYDAEASRIYKDSSNKANKLNTKRS